MRLEEVGAFREQPDQFVVGNLRLARLDHGFHLLDVVLPLAATPRMDEFPGNSRRRLAAGDGELLLGPAPPAPAAV
ncbi:MAG: hypothetical protein DWI27_02045 [Planctomycetota bacterium]|nr:MAG: hypothetical protein DWI27_02045 [Planctomycetota bacterium]